MTSDRLTPEQRSVLERHAAELQRCAASWHVASLVKGGLPFRFSEMNRNVAIRHQRRAAEEHFILAFLVQRLMEDSND